MRLTAAACCALTVLTLGAGCQGVERMKKMFGDLIALSTGISNQFGEPNTNIDVNNTTLTVTFTNSKLEDLPEPRRAALARNVARYVRDHYPDYPSLTKVAVAFKEQHGQHGATVSQTFVPYRYSTDELGSAPDSLARAKDSALAKSDSR